MIIGPVITDAPQKRRKRAAEARARSVGSGERDIRADAAATLLRCMDGQLDSRTADVQRRAALDILQHDAIEWMTDGQLQAHADSVLAEIERRQGERATK